MLIKIIILLSLGVAELSFACPCEEKKDNLTASCDGSCSNCQCDKNTNKASSQAEKSHKQEDKDKKPSQK